MDPTFQMKYVSAFKQYVAREINQKLWRIFLWTPCTWLKITNNQYLYQHKSHDSYQYRYMLDDTNQYQYKKYCYQYMVAMVAYP